MIIIPIHTLDKHVDCWFAKTSGCNTRAPGL